jgi:hypothetical protein
MGTVVKDSSYSIKIALDGLRSVMMVIEAVDSIKSCLSDRRSQIGEYGAKDLRSEEKNLCMVLRHPVPTQIHAW